MTEKNKWVKKIERLLRKANAPQYLHHFGPKKYCLWQHFLVLAIKQECKLGYRRACSLLSDLGFHVPTYSAAAKIVLRIPAELWQLIFKATLRVAQVAVAAIDGSTFSRSMPSYHYLRRIDRTAPHSMPIKTSILVDTRTRKVLAYACRILPRHDVKDVPALLKCVNIRTLVADKGYDAESVHELCNFAGIRSIIPKKSNIRRGFYRRKMLKLFNLRIYHRRETAECVFSRIKQCYGSFVRCRSARTIRAEITMRFILHNLVASFLRDFQHSLSESYR